MSILCILDAKVSRLTYGVSMLRFPYGSEPLSAWTIHFSLPCLIGVRVAQAYYLVYAPAPEPMAHGKFLFILSSSNIYPLSPSLFLLLRTLLRYEYLVSFGRRTSALPSCLYMQGLLLLIRFFC